MSQILVDIQKLRKTFSMGGSFSISGQRLIHAVNDVDLQIFQTETLGLVGESGCGKSTLSRLITALERPTSGSVFFEGKNIYLYSKEELKKYRRNVQLVFQDPYSSLNPRRSAQSIIAEPLVIHRMGNKNERRGMALELMEKVGLTAQQAHRYPHEFSGGQRQRIGIARALVLRPQLIIADEPVSALDVSIQAQILNLLKSLKYDFGLTYLFVSHDLNVIRHMADRIAVMYLGKIVELAPQEKIYANPSHPYTRLLLSAVPSFVPGVKKSFIPVKGEAGMENEKGCNFQNRCVYKKEICAQQEPLLREIENKRFCSCHLAGAI
ncbi:MAG TPA: ATP-binding cassette domain-containing protein [Deltaproteobacteria bacterium]|nr:ATP-binding cassette domain-containing protein [Deltaproteobacteria bacterium]